jgi:hypothetical protein
MSMRYFQRCPALLWLGVSPSIDRAFHVFEVAHDLGAAVSGALSSALVDSESSVLLDVAV